MQTVCSVGRERNTRSPPGGRQRGMEPSAMMIALRPRVLQCHSGGKKAAQARCFRTPLGPNRRSLCRRLRWLNSAYQTRSRR